MSSMRDGYQLAVVEFVVVVEGGNWWFGFVSGRTYGRWQFVGVQVDLTNIADV